MIYLSLVFPLLGFGLWTIVLNYFSQFPIEHLTPTVVYGVLCFDLLITLGSHALSGYFLLFPPVRFGWNWFAVVFLLILMIAFECVIRAVSLAMGEPIHGDVADAMRSQEVYVYLPIIGLGISIVWVLARKLR